MIDDFEIYNLLRETRKSKNISVEELASKVGVSKSTIRRWENRESLPDIKMGILISIALDCEVHDIFYMKREVEEIEKDEITIEDLLYIEQDFEMDMSELREDYETITPEEEAMLY